MMLHERSGLTSRWTVLAVLCCPIFIVNLDTTVLNVALPTFQRELVATHLQLQWIVDAYFMFFGGLLLAMGSLADLIGRKVTFIAGLIVFALASVWAARSGTAWMLIAARATMGIGAALIVPSTVAIITHEFPDEKEQGRAIAVWAATALAAFALGPLIGGALLARYWWGSIFLINIPVAIVGVLTGIKFVPNSRNPAAKGLDVVGTVLSIVALFLVLWAIIEAPSRGWLSGVVLGALVGGLLVIGAFVAWERRTKHPMLNFQHLRKRGFSVAVVCTALYSFSLFGTLFLLTPALQFYLRYSPFTTGLALLPTAVAFAISALFFVWLLDKMNVGVRLISGVGFLVVAAGLWRLSQAPASWSYREVLPWMVIAGAGVGLLFPTLLRSVLRSIPKGEAGVASGTNSTFMQVGAALGVAVLGSVMSARYQGHTNTAITSHHLHANQSVLTSLGEALQVIGHLTSHQDVLRQLVRSAFIDGTELALSIAACAALAGSVIAFLALPSKADEDASGKAGASDDQELPVPTGSPSSAEATLAQPIHN